MDAARRKHPRGRTAVVVSARIDDGKPCVVKNLSLGGVFVVTAHRWPIGQVKTLRLEHGEQPLYAEARVTHLQADGVGFAFASPDPQFLNQVLAIIEDFLSRPPDPEDKAGRRSDPRERVEGTVVWLHQNVAHRANLRDLSRTGAYIETTGSPALGTKIFTYLPGSTYSEGQSRPSELRGCAAEVVRHGTGGFACRFLRPSAEFTMAIEESLFRAKSA